MSDKPLSALVAAGWEVMHYSTSIGDSGLLVNSFLLRKNRDHKVLKVRAKMLGKGAVVEELDL